MRSLVIRTITGLLVVTAIVAGILWNPFIFLAIFSILIFGVLYEFYTLINISNEVKISRPIHSLAGVMLFVCAFCENSHMTSNYVFLLYLAYMMLMFISRLYTKENNPMRSLAYILMGQVYIACPLALLNMLAFHTLKHPQGNMYSDYSPIFILSLFLFIWINDTGAYLTGITCGKHKLFPSVSPKKTWEGFIGGLVFCILLGVGLKYDTFWNLIGLDIHDGIRLSHLEWVLMGMVVSVFSTFGDLIESFVKRGVGVKDSGNILPGHGGLWDRFDSLILATPAMVLFLIIITLW